jgi:endonuclease G
VLDFISYEGPLTATNGPASGLTATDIIATQTNAAVGTSLQRSSTGVWDSGASSFGACNPDTPVPVGNTIQFTGRTPGDVPLPVGFEDQLFGRLASPTNQTIPSTFTWEALTPEIATIDARGVIRALTVGNATFRATAAFDGTTATWTLPTRIAVASTTAQYANNAEFGEPVDSDPTDDLIIERPQYTSSWNPNRGSPNWVAYEIDATHFGAEDRCDCFTMDAELPASLPRIDTADYTGAGDFHGYGIDRGHLARSFDRTAGSLDNATTFYFSNIVPQAGDQNQGPWAQFENHLGDFARLQDREVYVLTGASGNKGTIKNEGKIVIPTHTWKVALILPRDQGLADVRDYRDVQVLAVIMPNEPGVRNVAWQTYLTTVDAVETLSGYDLLALLEDDVENAVESGTQPPIGSIVAPASALEGDTVNFSAAGSLDPNGSIASYVWDFGDGATGEGITASHTYAQDGVFTVRLTLVDNDGLADTTLFTLTVNNVAPVVAAVPNGSVTLGATYSVSGSFTDPGADTWTATVVWGDGSAPEVLTLTGRSFSLTHIYTAAGSYPVSIQIADDDGSGSTSHTVTVEQPAPTLGQALTLIDQLIAGGKMPRAIGIAFKAQVIAAQVLIGRGNVPAARLVLRATVAEIDLLVRLRVLKAADVAPLRSLLLTI